MEHSLTRTTVPHSGVRDLTTPGMEVIRSSAGPMATSLRDITLFLKTTMQTPTWQYDSTVISFPWVSLPLKPCLRIGLAYDNGVHTPTPPVRRGLKEAADLLRASDSVEIVEIDLPNVGQIYSDLLRYFTLDGAKVSPPTLHTPLMPFSLTPISSQNYLTLFALTSEPLIPSLRAIGLSSLQANNLDGLFSLNVRRQAAARTFHHLFRSNDLDAILMPPAPHTALPLDTWTSASYTGLWNYLDYPAVVIPVGTVSPYDVVDDVAKARYGDDDERLYKLCKSMLLS